MGQVISIHSLLTPDGNRGVPPDPNNISRMAMTSSQASTSLEGAKRSKSSIRIRVARKWPVCGTGTFLRDRYGQPWPFPHPISRNPERFLVFSSTKRFESDYTQRLKRHVACSFLAWNTSSEVAAELGPVIPDDFAGPYLFCINILRHIVLPF